MRFSLTHTPRFRKKAFTLTEMLVVMAIVSILAALLVPSLSRAKDSAHSVACMNNLRSAMMGMIMYLDDNDWKFPSGQMTGAVETIDITGGPFKQLIPYIYKEDSLNGMVNGVFPQGFVWECPSDKEKASFSGKGMPFAGIEFWPGSYGYNYSVAWEYLAFPVNPEGFCYMDKPLQVDQLAEVVIFSDTVQIPWIYPDTDPSHAFPAPENNLRGIDDYAHGFDGPGPFVTGAARHHGGVNMAFGDGHVRWVPKSEVTKIRTNWPLM